MFDTFDKIAINFFKKSLMLQGDTHIDTIDAGNILTMCDGKLSCLYVMRKAFEELLLDYPSTNGKCVLDAINKEITKVGG